MTKRYEADLCAAGIPIPMHTPCPRCGATENDECKLFDEMSPREIRENKVAYLRGLDPPH